MVWRKFLIGSGVGLVTSLVTLIVAAGLLVGLVLLVGPEGYFFPYPAIDTRFAPGYSEAQFNTIWVGMSKADVLRRLGPPLNPITDQGWIYSEDGAFGWWDFAWLARGVSFDPHGKVISISSFVAYD